MTKFGFSSLTLVKIKNYFHAIYHSIQRVLLVVIVYWVLIKVHFINHEKLFKVILKSNFSITVTKSFVKSYVAHNLKSKIDSKR